MKGSYILIIRLSNRRKIKVGKKIIPFKKGFYCYVGSAMNNLEKRIARHRAKKKKKHWHIDYFLEYGKIIEVIMIKSNKKIECQVSMKVSKKADGLVKGFGCSDCKCESHLYYFKRKPNKIKNSKMDFVVR
jgi:Uri superfamily endonuclease